MLNDVDAAQFRGWSIDYAIRLNEKKYNVTAEKILEDARAFNQYIEGRQSADVITMAKTNARTDSNS